MKDGREDIVVELLDREDVKTLVNEIWIKVFANSNRALHLAKKYGFVGIDLAPSPNVEEMLISLKFASANIDVLLNNLGVAKLGYDAERQLLNAKVQLTNLEQLANALKANNQKDFDKAVQALNTQAAF